MSASSYTTMASMMGQRSGQVGVPSQGFAAANIVGTAVPAVGDQRARPNYPGNVGGIQAHWHTIGVAVAVIGIGYLIYHFNFEK